MARTMNDKHTLTPEAAVDRLEAIYAGACAALSRSLDRYLVTRKPPTAQGPRRLPLSVAARGLPRGRRGGAHAARLCQVSAAGRVRHHGDAPGPLPPLPARAARAAGGRVRRRDLGRRQQPGDPVPLRARARRGHRPQRRHRQRARPPFPDAPALPRRRRGGDGQLEVPEGEPRPLSLFDAVRIDFSLRRLVHYTGATGATCSPGSCSPTITATSTSSCAGAWRACRGRRALRAPGAARRRRDRTRKWSAKAEEAIAASAWHRYQMPAYHLMARDGQGVTLVNIGVGPSNAKTITDHLAVLRPNCWLMIGHCGGLRQSQQIGDYVLAHAYLREDHMLDSLLPPDVPIPPLAEVQIALQDAAELVTGESGEVLKQRLRTGTVVTTDDRNWELRYSQERRALQPVARRRRRHGERHDRRQGLSLPRALRHAAVRLRQAAARRDQAAGRGQRLLRARDRPAPADRHRGPRPPARAPRHLHSRKLRSFDEPPFR